MVFNDYYAGKNDDNRRIDKIVRIFVSELSLPVIYKSLRKGLIKVNDKKVSQDYRVHADDKISIADFLVSNNFTDTHPVENQQNQNLQSNNELYINQNKKSNRIPNKHSETKIQILPEIVFRNENIIIFNKPRNLAVHGPDSLEKNVSEYYQNDNHSPASLSFKPGPLHRIDRFTTGLIAFSWSLIGAQWFSENIKNHSIKKIYYGIIQGKLTQKQEWTNYIQKNTDLQANSSDFHTVKVSEESGLGKKAFTTVNPVAYGKIGTLNITFAEFSIQTGRQHQIRAQAAQNGFPLYGDTAYGAQKNKENHFYLHAAKLFIPENPIGLPSVIRASLPEDFKQLLITTCDIKKIDL